MSLGLIMGGLMATIRVAPSEFVQAGMHKQKERFGSFFQLEGEPKFRKTFEPGREGGVCQLPDYVEIDSIPRRMLERETASLPMGTALHGGEQDVMQRACAKAHMLPLRNQSAERCLGMFRHC